MAIERDVKGGGTSVTISRTMVDRVAGLVRGAWDGWFGPGQPLTPIAPKDQVAGRQYDYPYGVNLAYQPRQEQGQNAISFATLRRVADPAQGGLDLVRIAIETRKDQFAGQPWALKGRKKNDDGGDVARALELELRRPDGVNTFRQWMRMLLEDHYVIDAPTVYFAPRAGTTPLLEIMDGATIKLLIDEGGRRPKVPLPAFQQFLKGVPAADYTMEEIGYYVYNQRPDRIYGQSRVEQIIGIITIALNRQLSTLSYFTEGSVPDAFITVPETWQPSQIKEYQEYWDAILSGQLGERRKARFIPGNSTITFTKTDLLKDEFDEWLARIVCYAFSLSPQALIKQMNRATSETAKETAQEEGLEPDKLWFKDVMDDVLMRAGYPELEWQWQDEEITDATVKATVISTYVAKKPIMLIEEAREMAGLKPATPEQLAQLAVMGTPPAPFGGGDGAQDDTGDGSGQDAIDKPDPAAKVRKAGSAGGRSLRRLGPAKRNVRLRGRTQRSVSDLAAEALAAYGRHVVAAVRASSHTEKLAKVSEADVRIILDSQPDDPWSADIRKKLEAALADYAADRSDAAVRQLESLLSEAQFGKALAQANERSVAWAQARIGNLITDVTDTTRDMVNQLTASAIDEGLTTDELAQVLEDSFAFSSSRAEMISRTETAFAETQGALAGYAESGVVEGKEWSTDPEACDECAALDGVVVGLDEDFPDGGGDGPPLHPNCECLVAPVVAGA